MGWFLIAVAVIAGLFGLLNIWYQAKVHRDNRADHAETGARISELTQHVRDVHDDVKDIRHTLRQHGKRLLHLEHPETPDEPS